MFSFYEVGHQNTSAICCCSVSIRLILEPIVDPPVKEAAGRSEHKLVKYLNVAEGGGEAVWLAGKRLFKLWGEKRKMLWF